MGGQVKLVLMLFLAMVIMGIDRSSIGVAAPIMMKELNMDTGSMGIILSAFFWTYALCNLPAGNLADRFGAKRILNGAVAIWSLASAATGCVHNLITIMAARMGVGVGEAGVFPANTKIVAEEFPTNKRGTVTGLYLSGARLGYAITPLLMGWLISLYSWRMAFIITGLGSLLWCVAWAFLYRKDERKERQDTAEKETVQKVAIPWLKLLTNRCALGLFFTKFASDYLYYMFLTWVPSYLVMERGFSLFKMGVSASIPFLAAFIIQPVAGYASDFLIRKGFGVTFARKGILVLAQLCGASIMAVNFVDDPVIVVAILTLNIAAGSTIGGMLFTLATEVAPAGMTGTVAGSMNTIGALAGILAPVLTGFVVKATGSFQLALMSSGSLLLLAVCAVLFVIPAVKPMSLK
ncbi:MAG: MFS transporter [Clostridiaceae bacterium]